MINSYADVSDKNFIPDDDFEIIKKVSKSSTSSDITNDYGADYYSVIIMNCNNKKKIDVEKMYYDILNINDVITIYYFEEIFIPIKGIYKGQIIKIKNFSKVRRISAFNFIK